MLNDAEQKQFENIVSWQQDGKGFKVHMQKEFTNIVMPSYFNQSQYKSFQRQLNIYGFSRKTVGAERGAYTHELLIRGKPGICRFMVRTKIKGKGSRSSLLQNPSSQLLKKLSAADSFGLGSHRSASCPTNLKKVATLNPSDVLRLSSISTADKNETFCNPTMQTGAHNAIFELKETSACQTRKTRSWNPFLQHDGVDMSEEGFSPMLNEEGILAASNASMPIRIVGRGRVHRRHSMSFDPPAPPENQSYVMTSPRTSSAEDRPPFWTLESSTRSKYHIQQPSPQIVGTGCDHHQKEEEEEEDMINSLTFASTTRTGIAFDSVSDFLNHDRAGHVLESKQEQNMNFQQYSIETMAIDDPMIPFLEENHQNQIIGNEQDLVTDHADEIIKLLGSQRQCAAADGPSFI